jgi:3-oxoacyl-[acyl-carrier protein] reductase
MIVVVTGASRGVGKMVADHYSEAGHTVIGLSTGTCDVSDPHAVRKVMASTPDLVVNCAAVAHLKYAILADPDLVRRQFDVNVLGTWNVCREAARLMARKKFGRIVNVSSIFARTLPAGTSIYTASKAAVEAMTIVLSREWAPFGITVNNLALSPIDTDMLRESGTPEDIEAAIAAQPLPRLATAEDVCGVIDFFAASPMVTGQTIRLGGIA